MKWEPERESCFSVLNSICTGTDESQYKPPHGKIHAQCLSDLDCIQQSDLDHGIGTCQKLQITSEINEVLKKNSSSFIASSTTQAPVQHIMSLPPPFSSKTFPCSANSAMQMTHIGISNTIFLVVNNFIRNLIFK
jgi:hypothetical protein